LLDVLEAIDRIGEYEIPDRETLNREQLIQVWVLHHLQIIGEAVNALAPEFEHRFPDVPWSEIIGMRNVLVHHYFGIDLDLVWAAVKRDLPLLRGQIRDILDQLGGEGQENPV
jgi:uncharacterized protein with HEPN domain